MQRLNAHTKIKNLPINNRCFIYSYFIILLSFLSGIVGSIFNNQLTVLLSTIVLIISIIVNLVFAVLKNKD